MRVFFICTLNSFAVNTAKSLETKLCNVPTSKNYINTIEFEIGITTTSICCANLIQNRCLVESLLDG